MSAEHLYEQGYDAFHYQRVAVGGEHELAVSVVALHPHAALAAVYEVLLSLVLVVQGLEVVAQVYENLVFVHPVVEVGELLHDLVLQFVYRLHALSILKTLSWGLTLPGTGTDT